jgi:DNA-binding PadR family transcriptional regulator
MEPLEIGDVIETTKPMNLDSLLHRAGERIYYQITDKGQLAVARELVASGRWRKQQVAAQPQKEGAT